MDGKARCGLLRSMSEEADSYFRRQILIILHSSIVSKDSVRKGEQGETLYPDGLWDSEAVQPRLRKRWEVDGGHILRKASFACCG